MTKHLLMTKWKMINHLRRYLTAPWVRIYLYIKGVEIKKNYFIFGCPVIQKHSESKIIIGSNFTMRNFFGSNPLGPLRPSLLSTRNSGAKIVIGDGVGITGSQICATKSIEIGDRVLIGANCIIVDTDFHPVDPELRKLDPSQGKSCAIVIEDDVFIGMNSMILKGVHIGKGSCIGAGSVVTKSVPAGVVVAGNPARVIRKIKEDC